MASHRTRVLLSITARCEMEIGFNGVTGFLYQSAKDNIKWHKLDVKRYIQEVMYLGRMISLDEEKWQEFLARRSAQTQTQEEKNKSLLSFFK